MVNKFKKISVILIAIVTIVGTFAINSFALDGHITPVSKVIPSATAIVEKTGGITQTPTAIAKNPYVYSELYTGGNVDNSVRINVYSTDYYTDDVASGGKALHYVFTSRNAFKFYIDFGSIPDILTYSGVLNPSNVSDIASYFNVSYKIGGARSINSVDRPYNLFSADSTVSGIYLGGTTLDSSFVTSSTYDSNIDFYNNFNYDSNIAGINYISGVVDGDVGNYYNFVDIQIRIADVDAGKVYFDGSTTNCDMLTDYFISGIYDRATSLGYDDGYDIGLDDGYENGYNVGTSDGYDLGYEEGNKAGYNVGYREGSDYGYALGYDVGYGYGYDDGFEAVGAFDFIIHGVEGFLTAELFPGFSFGLLLTSIAGLGMFIWILKIFAGG